ncbi:MAG TPA: malectin domain-containing carbohydrate-binding protein, partial [Sphingobacteriaceae bacterium]
LSASTSFTITVESAATLTEVIRINSGGGNIQFGNEVWTADQFFTGGSSSTYTTSTAISNTANDILYQSERYGDISYSIPVPQAGEYTVELHFAEIYFQSAGSRIFNINVENGQYTLPNVDLYKDHGGTFNAAVIKAESIQVNDGILNIDLTPLINNAKISGIAVFKQSAMDTAETVTIASLSPSNLTINKGPKLSNFDSMVLYPNPVQKSFSLKLKINQSSQWKFVLYSIAGEATPLLSYNFEEGIQTVNFDLYPFNLIPGIYHLLITNNLNERKTIKLIIEDKLSTY